MESISPEKWRERYVREAELRWVRNRPLPLIMIATLVAFAVTLAVLGFPLWRVSLLLCVTVLSWIMLILVCRPQRTDEERTWFITPTFVGLGVCAAVSGGLRSPLIVMMLGLPALLSAHGSSRGTRIQLGVAIAAILVTALVSPRLSPPVPDPVHTVFTVIFLVLTVALTVDHVVAISKALDASTQELLWERDRKTHEMRARAQELEVVSSKLSHELKNRLTAIKALVQLTARSSADPEVRERLEIVESEVDRMGTILHNYLAYSRPVERPELKPCALAPVVDKVLQVLQARAEIAGVRLQRVGKVDALADERRIKEALGNLISNAIEASAPNTRVEVALSEREGTAVIAVRDQGCGMSGETIGRIGTPFFTTREQGNGLGVLVARWVFTQHGGSLEYSSEPGKGTTAVGTLPMATEEVADGARVAG